MLIPLAEIKAALSARDISVHGVFHVGAHECEEMGIYDQMGLPRESVIWVDALEDKVKLARSYGVSTAFHAVIGAVDDVEVKFNVANNGQSSSLLELGTHAVEHPHITFVSHKTMLTTTVDTFFERENLDCSAYNLWNFDIQGAELLALRGAARSLPSADALYLEINTAALYENCALVGEIDEFLAPRGFSRVITKMTPHGWGDALYVRILVWPSAT
jgi:hypothetical protein